MTLSGFSGPHLTAHTLKLFEPTNTPLLRSNFLPLKGIQHLTRPTNSFSSMSNSRPKRYTRQRSISVSNIFSIRRATKPSRPEYAAHTSYPPPLSSYEQEQLERDNRRYIECRQRKRSIMFGVQNNREEAAIRYAQKKRRSEVGNEPSPDWQSADKF